MAHWHNVKFRKIERHILYIFKNNWGWNRWNIKNTEPQPKFPVLIKKSDHCLHLFWWSSLVSKSMCSARELSDRQSNLAASIFIFSWLGVFRRIRFSVYIRFFLVIEPCHFQNIDTIFRTASSPSWRSKCLEIHTDRNGVQNFGGQCILFCLAWVPSKIEPAYLLYVKKHKKSAKNWALRMSQESSLASICDLSAENYCNQHIQESFE